jgi:hypothetical protein
MKSYLKNNHNHIKYTYNNSSHNNVVEVSRTFRVWVNIQSICHVKKKKNRDSVTRTHTTGYFWCDAVVLALAVTIDFPRLPPEEDKHAGTWKQLNRQTIKRIQAQC